MAGQLHFTNAAPRPGRPGGFRTVAASPSLDAETLRRMERLCAYETPTRSAAAEPGGPVAFGYRDGCLVRCVNLGLDHTGRPGNLFGHVVQAGEAELGGLRPIELWASALWRDRPGDGALAEVGRLEPGSGPRTEDVARLVADGGTAARDTLAACVEYAVAVLRQPDALVRPLVLVSRSTELAVVWLAALSFSLPESLAGALTFTTYAARPASAGVHVAATVPEVRDLGGPDIPVLDLDALGRSAGGRERSGAAEWGESAGLSGSGGWPGSDRWSGHDGMSGQDGWSGRDAWASPDERTRRAELAEAAAGRTGDAGLRAASAILAPHGIGRYAAAVADAWARRDFAVVDLLTTWHVPSGAHDPEWSPPLAVATVLAGHPLPAATAGAAARWLGQAGPSLDPEILGRLVELDPLPASLARAIVELAGVGAYAADARAALAVARQLKRLLHDGATTPEDLVGLVRQVSGGNDGGGTTRTSGGSRPAGGARAAGAGGGSVGVGGGAHGPAGGAHDRHGSGAAAAAGGLPGLGDGSGLRGTGGAHGRHGGGGTGSAYGRHASGGTGDADGARGGAGASGNRGTPGSGDSYGSGATRGSDGGVDTGPTGASDHFGDSGGAGNPADDAVGSARGGSVGGAGGGAADSAGRRSAGRAGGGTGGRAGGGASDGLSGGVRGGVRAGSGGGASADSTSDAGARPLWLDPVALREAADRCGRAYPERVGGALRTLLPRDGRAHTDAEEALLRGFVDVLGDEARTAHGERRGLHGVDTPTARLLARFLTSEKLQLWRDVPDLTCEIFSRPHRDTDMRRLATIWLVWLGDHGVARRRVADGLETVWRGGSPAGEVFAAVDATAADAAAVPVLLDLVYRALRLEHPGDQDQVALAHWVLTRSETDPAPPGGRRVAEVCAELTLAVNDVAQCIAKFGRSARQTREATAAARHWLTHAPYPHAQAADEILTHLYEPRKRQTSPPPAPPPDTPGTPASAAPAADKSAKPKLWPKRKGKQDPSA
ncbi:hypothetical protein ACPA54_04120 [Uniformispora flossi]|uniref:GAP1-N2 domain-containing protein n=1 Tax=Uniformispora flossi TaxID=3390723 RepID=UPI003C2FD800